VDVWFAHCLPPPFRRQLEALEEYLEGGVSVKSVVYQVTNGKNAMPAFGGRLSDEDIENVSR
jgi:cytochrome c6